MSFSGSCLGPDPATLCLTVDAGVQLGIVLTCGDTALRDEEISEAVAPWLDRDKCKASCVAMLQRARGAGAGGPLAAIATRLARGSTTSVGVKRQRVEKSGQVRCRHILVRHAGSRQPYDKVRRKSVQRSLEAAEALQLGVLEGLVKVSEPTGKGACGFTAQCRQVSECDSSLKGGELAGDLGWLDLTKRYEKAPPPLPKVAFNLQVPIVPPPSSFNGAA